MSFVSFEFLLFLPVVFLLYWFIFKPLKWQNLLILAASYVFYGLWNWRFLGLIIVISSTAYGCGIWIFKLANRRRQKLILALNLVVSLGVLAIFKYYDFFVENINNLLLVAGIKLDAVSINLVLPIGISFYTLQSLGYAIDVYRRKLKPCYNVVNFFAFISFFPQLVAGPIERATNLLPQFERVRRFDYSLGVDGMRQILWGSFKKVVVANTCANGVDYVFANHNYVGGLDLVVALILFSFQIYGDFSGYSDIAIGVSKLFGINLMQNFKFPFFSRSVSERWRRWHVSLATWFRDYLYIPLGGNRHGLWITLRNTFVVFAVSGLWHGAEWTFVLWGVFNGIMVFPEIITSYGKRFKHNTVAEGKYFPSMVELGQMLMTYIVIIISYVFFRSDNMTTVIEIFKRIFTNFTFTEVPYIKPAMVYIIILLVVEWIYRFDTYGLKIHNKGLMRYRIARWAVYYFLTLLVFLNLGQNETFIYFQF